MFDKLNYSSEMSKQYHGHLFSIYILPQHTNMTRVEDQYVQLTHYFTQSLFFFGTIVQVVLSLVKRTYETFDDNSREVRVTRPL